MKKIKYDVLIVGAGPIGLACGIEAQKRKLSHIIVEKGCLVNSAVDIALELFRIGSEVTMIIREFSLKENIKYWVKPDIENRMKEGAIKAYFNSTLERIFEKTIEVITPNGKITLPNDFVFAMTGYHPDFTFLRKIGIQSMDDEFFTPIFNPDSYETDKKGIYLAGVVCCGMDTSKLFIENSREHAAFIFDHLERTNIVE